MNYMQLIYWILTPMNPLTNTVRMSNGVMVAGKSGESGLDKFFREQLKYKLYAKIGDRDDPRIDPIAASDMVNELRKLHVSPEFISVSIKLNAKIIPAYRDSFGSVWARREASLKQDLTVDLEKLYTPTQTLYNDLVFVVFRYHIGHRGWQDAFFVNRNNLVFITDKVDNKSCP
jgi:hypothetical protein